MSLTSGAQLNLAMNMRDEFFMERYTRAHTNASYSVSIDTALKIVKWFEQQQETQLSEETDDGLDPSIVTGISGGGKHIKLAEQETQNVEARPR